MGKLNKMIPRLIISVLQYIFVGFLITALHSCKSDYNEIEEFFPKDTVIVSQFIYKHFNFDTVKVDTVEFRQTIRKRDNKTEYRLVMDSANCYMLFKFSFDPDFVTVEADSFRGFSSVHYLKYLRTTDHAFTPPDSGASIGLLQSIDNDGRLAYSVPWPHIYKLYFMIENENLVIVRISNFKTDFIYKFYFSKEKGLYKVTCGDGSPDYTYLKI